MTAFSDLFLPNGTPQQATTMRANDVNRTILLNALSVQLDTVSAAKYDFIEPPTPSATQSGETWLDTDDGKVYNSTGSGTGNWVFAYQVVLVDTLNHVPNNAIGNIDSPLVDFALQNDLNLVRSAGGYGSETFTRSTVKNYIDRYGVVQQAAIDNPAFEKEGLLLEGPSTNKCLQSEDFDTTWSKDGGATVTINDTNAPDGTATADKIIIGSGGGGERLSQSIAITDTGQTVCISVFVKDSTITNINIRAFISGGTPQDANIDFNISTQAITEGTVDDSGFETLDDDWFRVWFTITLNNTGQTSIDLRVGGEIIGGSSTGDFFAWGAQLEELSLASSYIITTVSAVTRTVNLSSIQYAGNLPAPEDDMTILIDINTIGTVLPNDFILKIIGEANRDIFNRSADNKIIFRHGTTQLLSTFGLTIGQTYRIGYVNDGTSLLMYIDGELNNSVAQEAVTGTATGQVAIGSNSTAGGIPFYGHISNMRILNRALTDSEMRIT